MHPEPPPSEALLVLQALACRRGDALLFDGLDASLEAGELLWLGGANGAGKTSLLRMLCGLMQPEHGEVRWRGCDIRAQREEFARELLYLGHANAVKDEFDPVENLRLCAALQGQRVTEREAVQALADIGLGARLHLPARHLSQGQRRRVALARLWVGQARTLWVLDEPFVALDRVAVAQLCGVIAAHLGRGGMVIYTTHQEVDIPAPRRRRLELGAGCQELAC